MAIPNTPKDLNIIAYLKPQCGWSGGVRAVLRKYNLAYQDRDIINDPAQRREMEQKSGQPLSPCVEVAGVMLADISGAELESYLIEKKLVKESSSAPEAPIDSPCASHAAPEAGSASLGRRR
jgi:glutaredoxin-related protein